MTTQDIGIPLDLSKGTFTNTELVNNVLQLKSSGNAYDGSVIYLSNGVWESDIIDLVDKYTSLENLAITNIVSNGASIKAYTRTSDTKSTWDSYVEIEESTGKMLSIPRRFIQVKIDFYSGIQDKAETVNEFTSDELSKFQSNEYVDMDGSLKLQTDYKYNSVIDNTWTDEGHLFRKTIQKSKFKRIDSINVTNS